MLTNASASRKSSGWGLPLVSLKPSVDSAVLSRLDRVLVKAEPSGDSAFASRYSAAALVVGYLVAWQSHHEH